jgi:hypothetical protein
MKRAARASGGLVAGGAAWTESRMKTGTALWEFLGFLTLRFAP